MHPQHEPLGPPETDDVTLARAQHGDPQAFERLIKQHESLVWAYLWRMLGPAASTAAVEDLFQETFLGVHRALPRFRVAGPARLSTWILAIATRVALYALRRGRRDGPPADVVDRGDDGAAMDGMEARSMVRSLVRALDGLTPEHRAIFVLRTFHELDYAEIAHTLDLEVGTVRSRLHRARESLLGALAEGHHG